MSYQQGYGAVETETPPRPGSYQQLPPQQPPQQGGWWYAGKQPANRSQINEWVGGNEWATSTLGAPCNEPSMCLLGFIAPWCCVMQQRKKLLMENMQNYECCAGLFGPSCTERCNGCTAGNEDVCLCLESFFCLSCAVHGNRWMVMQHYNLQHDCCDVFIMWLSCFCRVLACLLRSRHLEHCASLVYYMTIGCMLAQHEFQMKAQGYPIGTQPAVMA